jgi:hypothetical protein
MTALHGDARAILPKISAVLNDIGEKPGFLKNPYLRQIPVSEKPDINNGFLWPVKMDMTVFSACRITRNCDTRISVEGFHSV